MSRVPYDPSALINGEWAAEVAHRTTYDAGAGPQHHDGVVVAGDDAPNNVDAGFPNPRLERVACVVRDVGTYLLPDGGVNPLEVRQNLNAANFSAGRNGFNIPSLTGLRYSAPYLHHGAAPTLAALLTDSRWTTHTTAGNAAFAPTANDVLDLVAFLESIDDSTPVFAIPAGAILCPTVQ